MDLSIIIPAFDEEKSISPLCNQIQKNLKDRNIKYEVILIDDGSQDNTWEEIIKVSKKTKNIITIKI